MPFDDFNVEALPPDRGTVMFIAQTGESPASGVEIRIDGESKGFTREDGKLKVEWLLFGKHTGVEIRIDGESKGFTREDGKLKVEWLLFGKHTWGQRMKEREHLSRGI